MKKLLNITNNFGRYLILLSIFGSFVFTEIAGQTISEDFLEGFEYRSIGPTRMGGRYVDFAVVESNPTTFYAATATGGLWKTINNGITYFPVFDNETIICIGDVAVAPSDPNIVWVGTGEANNSRTSYYGDGVYKSTDAGKTWQNMGLKESHHVGRVVIHPADPDIVYIAALGHLYSENPERGVYKTTNGGKKWDKVLEVVDHDKYIGVVDLVMDPSNPDILYAAAYDKVRRPWTFNPGGPGSGIYKTIDAGKNWTKLENGLPGGMLGKIGLDVSVSNPNVLYANIENVNVEGVSDEERYKELLEGRPSSGRMVGDEMYRSDDKGGTWRKVSPDGEDVGGGPAYYYQQVRIDPSDENHVYVLGMRMYETKDGGENWGRPFNFGGDNHAMWIDPDDPKHLLLGYDHGMGITYDAGENWYHPDELPLGQFVAIGVDMEYPYNVYGGMQDNGSKKGPSTKRSGGPIIMEDWKGVGGGDGMYNQVDYSNNRWLYNESQFAPLSRRDLKTGESKSIAYRNINRNMRWAWNAPIVISPHNSDVIYHAGNKVIKSNYRGEAWEEISPDLTNNDSAKIIGTGNIQYCTIVTMDESPVVEGVIWIGTDDGNVQLTKDGGENWIKLNDNITGNPGYWVSRVEASNFDAGTAYVTYTGYRRDDFKPFIYKTADYGETWTSISGNLPDESVCVIKEDHKNPKLLFAGTTKAVYVSIDGGSTWTKMQNNMPNQPVEDLLIHPRENDLVIGTHGRSIFITNISPLQELSSKTLEQDVYLFNIEPKVKWVNTGNNDASSNNFNGQSEPLGVVIDYYLKEAKDDVKIEIYQGARLIFEIEGAKNAGMNQETWNMVKRDRERTDREKQQINSQMERLRGFGLSEAEMRMYMGSVDMDYITSGVSVGEYLIVLSSGDKKMKRKAVIKKDHWYDD